VPFKSHAHWPATATYPGAQGDGSSVEGAVSPAPDIAETVPAAPADMSLPAAAPAVALTTGALEPAVGLVSWPALVAAARPATPPTIAAPEPEAAAEGGSTAAVEPFAACPGALFPAAPAPKRCANPALLS
jgi:hypothetical protein